MYCRESVDCLCPQCIANGEAAKKFNGQFVQSAEDFKVNDESKRQELYCRTPGYISWQGEYWLACCEDYCAYIGEVGTKELEEMALRMRFLRNMTVETMDMRMCVLIW